MTNYYFLATALPPLQIGVRPEINFDELEFLFRINLTEKDYAKTEVIRRFYDILNIRAFWKGEELDPYGTLDPLALEEALLSREGLPEYVYSFTDQYDSIDSRIHHFPKLLTTYFTVESERATGFLRDYLAFERSWRLVLVGLRAKQLGRDLLTELQFEDAGDDIVAQLLAQKDAKSFVPPEEYQSLDPLFEEHAKAPLELYQALNEYRFRKIESLVGIDLFSIDNILGYMVQLIALEKWFELDKKKGMLLVETLLHNPPPQSSRG